LLSKEEARRIAVNIAIAGAVKQGLTADSTLWAVVPIKARMGFTKSSKMAVSGYYWFSADAFTSIVDGEFDLNVLVCFENPCSNKYEQDP
jgi:hypothetical protein